MARIVPESLRLWSRRELQRRWAGLVLLGVLGGLAAGLAIAAVDGARRSGTSYERMREQLDAADAIFFPSQVQAYDTDVSQLGDLPEVAAWGGFALMDGRLDGFAPGDGPFYPVGQDWFTTIERAKVLQGRLPDPARDDEAVITSPDLIAATYGVHVGDTIVSRTLSKEQQASYPEGAPPDFDWARDAKGPTTAFHIVGAVRLPLESVTSFASTGLLLPSPGWMAQHGDEVQPFFTNAIIRLRHGAADIPALRADVARIYGREDLPVKDLSTDIQRVNRSVDLERTAIYLFGLAVALAGAVVVGQSLARSLRAGAESVPALSAMGLPTSALVVGVLVPHLVAVAAAVVVAGGAAVVLSGRFPVGLSRQLDPASGIRVNAGLLAIGLLATLLIAMAAAVAIAFVVVRGHHRRHRLARTRAVGAGTRAGLPVPTAVGVSLALERGPTRTAPVRPALVASVVGILGVVGGVTLVKGIDGAVHDPATTGAVWDVEAQTSPELDEQAAIAQLDADARVRDWALVSRLSSLVGGHDVPLYALDVKKGAFGFVVLHGRAPSGDHEVALGPATAKLVKAKVGDQLPVGPESRPLDVVGIALFPTTPHSAFDEGAWVSPAVVSAAAEIHTGSFQEYGALIRLQRDVEPAAWIAGLSQDWYATPPAPVTDVQNLGRVRSLPLYLAAFLCLLALGAAAHALLTGTRRRAHELAVLRSFGLTPAQTARCVAWQAAVIGVVALAIGVPLGIIVGRQLWRMITSSLSAVYHAPISAPVLVLIGPAVLVVLVLMALWPARSAARLRTAQILRSE